MKRIIKHGGIIFFVISREGAKVGKLLKMKNKELHKLFSLAGLVVWRLLD